MRFTEDVCWSRLFENNGSDIVFMNDLTNMDVNWIRLFETDTPGGDTIVTEGEFGVEWDYSKPSPALTRTGDATGFSDPIPATSLSDIGTSPFDRIMPWAGMKMCNIIDGRAEYWQGDPQFSEAEYDTMVFIPEFWYKAEKDTAANKWRWSISPTEKDGYAKHPGSGRYISRFQASGSSRGVYSKSGIVPMVNVTRANLRQYSHRKGSGWWMLDIATWSAVQMLYLVEFASFQAQETLGTGQEGGNNAVATGDTDGAKYHTLKRTAISNQYRWLENPYSNIQIFLDGILMSDRQVYAGLNNAVFADSTSALVNTGIALPESGNISGFGYSNVCPWAFIPDSSIVDNDGTTYVTDRVGSAEDTKIMTTGGYSQMLNYYGLYYFNATIDISDAVRSRGTRLIFIP